MASRTRLLSALDVLEEERGALLALLKGRPNEVLAKVPGPDKWSVAQVVLHLAIAEELATTYIAKKRSFGGARPVTIMSELRLTALRVAFVLPIKFKAPKGLGALPPIGIDAANERWDNARRALRATLLSVPEHEIGHALFKHPAAGKLDLVQGVRSITIHVRRHAGQIKRILGHV